ncbi:MAG: aquaporin [Bryobacteraceae bacterium]
MPKREYFMEAINLGLFMLSACVFGTILGHPNSPAYQWLEDPLPRRGVMGAAMGLTALLIIHSPMGQSSGAHMNPAFTLAYWTLGRLDGTTAAFYVFFQFLGGTAGVSLAHGLVGPPLAHSAVNYVVTVPGPSGTATAFAAEFVISGGLMLAVLVVSNRAAWSRWTPTVASALVAVYIVVESPLSGMSMNPARSFGSGFAAEDWSQIWIYFTAPPLGMLFAAAVFRLAKGADGVFCAKLHHHNKRRCIFRCRHGEMT